MATGARPPALRPERPAPDLDPIGPEPGPGLRISDAATRAGVSPRTLRYYEELGLLTPGGYTSGGERRYLAGDLVQLDRILELKQVLGLNLDEVRGVLETENRLDELRSAYRARQGEATPSARAGQRAILEEALALRTTLAAQLDAKMARMDAFRETLAADTARCRSLLDELGSA